MTENKIPRSKENDYTHEAAAARRDFLKERTGVTLQHVGQFSTDPQAVSGNCENFMGMIQMPVGIAGPVLINGEYAQGEFYVPLATTEGTLVASYSRGMRAITECGGIKTTVVEDVMQRSPGYKFADARQARDFGRWLDDNFARIKEEADSTSSVGRLVHIQKWSMNRCLYTRFNYTTGDAAGQNMVSKATDKACKWIAKNYPGEILDYTFNSNTETDKKHSQMHMLHTRGKRVIAELVLKKEVMDGLLRTTAQRLMNARNFSNVGAALSVPAYNGPHSANGIASLFIATGQDEANVVESHAGNVYTEALPNGDLYWSVTLPAIIVATFGGGTGLPSQRECLEMMDCYGKGKARKLAEIVAATVVAGDISISSAAQADEFVNSHEKYGRNR